MKRTIGFIRKEGGRFWGKSLDFEREMGGDLLVYMVRVIIIKSEDYMRILPKHLINVTFA